jgi:transcriptional regulator with XRE-family HTH domain
VNYFAKRLGDARRERRLRGKDVAQSAGITPGYYSEIESGKRRPSEELAKKLAVIVGKPFEYLSHPQAEPFENYLRDVAAARNIAVGMATTPAAQQDVFDSLWKMRAQAAETRLVKLRGLLKSLLDLLSDVPDEIAGDLLEKSAEGVALSPQTKHNHKT